MAEFTAWMRVVRFTTCSHKGDKATAVKQLLSTTASTWAQQRVIITIVIRETNSARHGNSIAQKKNGEFKLA